MMHDASIDMKLGTAGLTRPAEQVQNSADAPFLTVVPWGRSRAVEM